MAVVDAATGGQTFDEIDARDVAALPWSTPVAQPATATQTVIVRRADDRVLKIDQFTVNRTEGTVSFASADLTPLTEGGCP